MKKSNLILISALIAIVFFSLAFQLTVHSYIKEDKANKVPEVFRSEERKTDSFGSIKTGERLRILLFQDSIQSVTVKANNSIIDSVQTSVDDGELLIKMSKDIRKKDSIVVEISCPEISALRLSGKSYVESNGILSGEQLRLELDGSSSVNLELNYKTVLYNNTSDGDIEIQGDIKNIQITNQPKE
ncbi:GIN domain-containing protein [Flagellimonas allohymeniacidonis]|uniref:Putative auto-transporter adhesin head GIN domain-containing protein n=1 Tax=Flagellimonas allohymeniacidonis TaxID=2517819 RepID=A0A4Q8QFA6_9FLAO|nr:DUF2807 domain-containing protein [Allomuricauda hymeniacidonis]TAI49165.1 hypothetical protein EW142_05040 [Allomuricauda hymeniacidonis]